MPDSGLIRAFSLEPSAHSLQQTPSAFRRVWLTANGPGNGQLRTWILDLGSHVVGVPTSWSQAPRPTRIVAVAPLPPSLKGGRDLWRLCPFLAPSLQLVLRALPEGGQASLRAGWGCEPASLEELDCRTMRTAAVGPR
jgi:hypothetical protein